MNIHSGPFFNQIITAKFWSNNSWKFPFSLIFPFSNTTILSTDLIVLKRCAIIIVVRLRIMWFEMGQFPMGYCESGHPLRGDPQPGLAMDILRINFRISLATGGLPGFPFRLSFAQWSRKRWRCQATTVAGLTMTNASRQSDQSRDNHAQRRRSAGSKLGRLDRW